MSNIRLTIDEYETLIEQSPILIWRAGTNAECDYFNERWLAFTGRSLEQERGNGWADGVHPDDLQRCLKIYQDPFQNRETFEMEYGFAGSMARTAGFSTGACRSSALVESSLAT